MCVRSRPTIVVLLAVTWLGSGLTGNAADSPSLDELLKEYRKHELPLPPREAKLVRYLEREPGITVINGKLEPRTRESLLAFLVKPGEKKEHPWLLTGTRQWQPDWEPHLREVAPEPEAVKGVSVYREDGLILAIQCHARGWDRLARHLLERSQKDAAISLRNQLLNAAWEYWCGRLTEPTMDRTPVAKHLKELLRQNKEWDTEEHRALLKSLDLALAPRKSKPGSIEALIDDLVDYSTDTGTIGIFEPEDRYWRIARRGFDAVPALLEHLDDDRLTRAIMQGFNNFPSWNLRVRDVVSDLLEGLAGEDIGRDWLRRQQGYAVKKAEAKKWWDEARKVGEETYLLDHVFVDAAEGRKAHVSEHLLYVILAKYPRHVPSLYRTALEKRPELNSGMLADAVGKSKLPAREKLALLVHGAKHKDYHHRLPALHALKELDRKQFNALLLATIESFPKDVPGPYWTCPEAHIAGLATECDDPRIWPTLEKVAKRSAVGLRMEILKNSLRGSGYRAERIRLLAAFLDDGTVRLLRGHGSKFEGPCAGFIYKTIEVRDFVALELAQTLGIDIEVKLDRSAEEWARVRDRVREALKREQSEGFNLRGNRHACFPSLVRRPVSVPAGRASLSPGYSPGDWRQNL
jgi:hypothetical protein